MEIGSEVEPASSGEFFFGQKSSYTLSIVCHLPDDVPTGLSAPFWSDGFNLKNLQQELEREAELATAISERLQREGFAIPTATLSAHEKQREDEGASLNPQPWPKERNDDK